MYEPLPECKGSAHRGHQGASDPLELELQKVVSYRAWELRPESGSSSNKHALNC